MNQMALLFFLLLGLSKAQASLDICEKIEEKGIIPISLHTLCKSSENCLTREYDEQKITVSSKPLKLRAVDLYIQQNLAGPHKLAIELSERSRCFFEKTLEANLDQKFAVALKEETIFSGNFSSNLENEVLVLPLPRSWSIEEIQSICHHEQINCMPKRFLLTEDQYKRLLAAKVNFDAKKIVDYSRVWLHFTPQITTLEGLELKLGAPERELFFGFQEKEKGASAQSVELAALGKIRRDDLVPLNMLNTVEELKRDLELAFAMKSCQTEMTSYYKNVNLLFPQYFYSRNLKKDLHLFSLNASSALCTKIPKKDCLDFIEKAAKKQNETSCKDYLSKFILTHLQEDEESKQMVHQCLIEKKTGICHNLGFVLSSHALNREALNFYAQACNLGYIPSCINGGLISEELNETSQAELLYGKACQEENPTSCFAQSKVLLKMGNSEKAKAKALKACELKQGAACSLYGTFLEQDKDEAGALSFYDRSCQASDPHGCLNWGRLNLRLEKRKVAKEAFEKSCKLSLKEGCLALSSFHFLQSDFSTAQKGFTKLCKEGLRDACFYSSKIYAQEKKVSESIKALEKSFELGKKVDEQVLFEDSSFKNLRKNKNFQELLERYKNK